MGLGNRSARRHESAVTAGVNPEDYWDFKPGQRVMTVDGFLGRVTAVNDGPIAGSESYDVVLDNGLGGGEYTASQLTAASRSVAAHENTAAKDYPELADILRDRPDPGRYPESTMGMVASLQAQAWDAQGGPETDNESVQMGGRDDVTEQREDMGLPPLEAAYFTEQELREIGQAAADRQGKTAREILDETARAQDEYFARQAASGTPSVCGNGHLHWGDECPRCSDSHAMVVNEGDHRPDRASEVKQAAHDDSPYNDDFVECDTCGGPHKTSQHASATGADDAGHHASKQAAWWSDGYDDLTGHDEMEKWHGMRPSLDELDALHDEHARKIQSDFDAENPARGDGCTVCGNSDHDTHQHVDDHIESQINGLFGPGAHSLIGEQKGQPTKYSSKTAGRGRPLHQVGDRVINFRGDSSGTVTHVHETGSGRSHKIEVANDEGWTDYSNEEAWDPHPDAPKEQHERYSNTKADNESANALLDSIAPGYTTRTDEQGRTFHDFGPLQASIRHGYDMVRQAALKPSLAFHVTATWADVRRKAKRIRTEGGVHITHAEGGYVIAKVKGDHDTYESVLLRAPGSQKVAQWDCGCPWAKYHWGAPDDFSRFAGRMCSHTLALHLESQARGMFGRDVRADEGNPNWLTRSQMSLTSALNLPDHAPIHLFAALAIEAGAEVPPLLDFISTVAAVNNPFGEPVPNVLPRVQGPTAPRNPHENPAQAGFLTAADPEGWNQKNPSMGGTVASLRVEAANTEPIAMLIQHHDKFNYGLGSNSKEQRAGHLRDLHDLHRQGHTHVQLQGPGVAGEKRWKPVDSSAGAQSIEDAINDYARKARGGSPDHEGNIPSSGIYSPEGMAEVYSPRVRQLIDLHGQGFTHARWGKDWDGDEGNKWHGVIPNPRTAALEPREAWAQLIVPLVRAVAPKLMQRFGPEVADRAVNRFTNEHGEELTDEQEGKGGEQAAPNPGNKINDFAKGLKAWTDQSAAEGQQALYDQRRYSTLHDEPEPALPRTDGAEGDDLADSLDVPSLAPDEVFIASDVVKQKEASSEFRPFDGPMQDFANQWGHGLYDPTPTGTPTGTVFEVGSSDSGAMGAGSAQIKGDPTSLEPEDPSFVSTGAQAPSGEQSVEDIVAAFQATSSLGGAGGSTAAPIAQQRRENSEIAQAAKAFLSGGQEGLQAHAMAVFTPAQQQEMINEGEGGPGASNLDRLQIEGTHYEALDALDSNDDEGWLD